MLKARRRCIEYLKSIRNVSSDYEALKCPTQTEQPVRLLDKVELQAEPHVRQVLEDDVLFDLYKRLYLAGSALEEGMMRTDNSTYPGTATSNYKWLRAVGTGLFTGVHTGTAWLKQHSTSCEVELT